MQCGRLACEPIKVPCCVFGIIFAASIYALGVVTVLTVSVKYINPFTGCSYSEPNCPIKQGCYFDWPLLCAVLGFICGSIELLLLLFISCFIKFCCMAHCNNED